MHSISIEFSYVQITKMEAWLTECNKKAVEYQKETFSENMMRDAEWCWKDGYPYSGAIGGSHSYKITPTSLGQVVQLEFNHPTDTSNPSHREILDVTEYEDW